MLIWSIPDPDVTFCHWTELEPKIVYFITNDVHYLQLVANVVIWGEQQFVVQKGKLKNNMKQKYNLQKENLLYGTPCILTSNGYKPETTN